MGAAGISAVSSTALAASIGDVREAKKRAKEVRDLASLAARTAIVAKGAAQEEAFVAQSIIRGAQAGQSVAQAAIGGATSIDDAFTKEAARNDALEAAEKGALAAGATPERARDVAEQVVEADPRFARPKFEAIEGVFDPDRYSTEDKMEVLKKQALEYLDKAVDELLSDKAEVADAEEKKRASSEEVAQTADRNQRANARALRHLQDIAVDVA